MNADPVRVLYIDDYEADGQLVREVLEREGARFKLTQAANRQEFEARLDSADFDLVLSDFNLLGFRDFQLLETVRQSRPETPVVIVTGSGSKESAVEAIRRGAADYVIKTPEDIRRLPHALLAVLEAQHLRTERSRTEQDLQTSENNYRILVENSQQGIAVFQEGKIVFANPALAALLGFSTEELLAFSPEAIIALIHPDDQEFIIQGIQKNIDNEWPRQTHRVRILHPEGATRWMEILAHPMDYMGKPAVQTFVLDVTERVRARQIQGVISNIVDAAINMDSLEDLYRLIDAELSKIIRTDNFYIALFDAEANLLYFSYYRDESYPDEAIYDAGRSREPGRGLTEYLIRTARALFATEETIRELAHQGEIDIIGPVSKVWLGAPLQNRGQTIGVIAVQSYKSAGSLTLEDLGLLEFVSSQIGVAVQRVRADEMMRVYARRLEALREIDGAILAAESPKAVAAAALRHLRELVPFYRIALMMFDWTSQRATRLVVETQGKTTLDSESIFELTDENWLSALRKNEHYQVADLESETHLTPIEETLLKEGLRTYLSLPLKVHGELIGAINIGSEKVDSLTMEHVEIVREVANSLAVAIAQARLYESERAERRAAEALAASARDLSATLDLGAIFDLTLDRLREVLPYDAAALVLLRDDSAEMVASRGFSDLIQIETQRKQAGGILPLEREVVVTREPVIVYDTREEKRWKALDGLEHIRAWMGVPLMTSERVLGHLMLQKAEPGFYTPASAALASAFAAHVAIAIHNARLFHTERMLRNQQAAVHATSLDIASSQELPVLLNAIVERAVRLLQGTSGAMYLADADRREVRCVVSYRTDYDYLGTVLSYGEGAAGTVAEIGKPLIIDDYHRWDGRADEFHGEGQIIALVSAPLPWHGKMIGVVHVFHDAEVRRFTAEDMELLQQFANQAAVAVGNARLFEAVQRRAEELSGLHRISQAFSSLTDYEETFGELTERIGRLIGASLCAILLYDPETGMMTAKGPGYGLQGVDISAIRYPARLAREYWDFQARGPFRAGSRADIPDFGSEVADRLSINSLLSAPIRVEDRMLGVVMAANKPGGFTDDDAQLLAVFSSQAGAVLKNAQLFDSERSARRLAETLLETMGALTANLDLDRVLVDLLTYLERVIPFDSASVMLASQAQIEIVAQHGFRSRAQQLSPMRIDAFPHIQEVIQDRAPLIISDTRKDPRWKEIKGTEYILCWLGAPLIVQGQVIGLLNLDKEQPAYYRQQALEVVMAFANQAAVAIENARLFLEVRKHSDRIMQVLRFSEVLHGGLDLGQVLTHVASSVREIGFQRVSLNVREPDSDVVKVMSAEGMEPMEQELLLGASYRWADFEALMTDDLRQSNSYLIRHGDIEPDLTKGGPVFEPYSDESTPDYWRSEDGLLVPLRGAGGATVGLLAVGDPADKLVPNLETIQVLETYANQAAIAIENARLLETERRTSGQLEVLRQVGMGLVAELDLDVLLHTIVERAVALLGAKSGGLYLYRSSLDLLEWVVAIGPNLPPAGARLRRGQGISGRVWQTGEASIVDDYVKMDNRSDSRAEYRWACTLAVPFSSGSEFLGVLKVLANEPGAFSQSDTELLGLFANQAAVAIKNARLFEAAGAAVTQADRLREAAAAVVSDLDFDQVLETILVQVEHVVAYESARLFLLEQEGLRLVTARNLAQPEQIGELYPLSNELYQELRRTRKPVILSDAQADPRFVDFGDSENIRSWMGVPMVIHDGLVGYLTFESHELGAYTQRQALLAQAFANTAAAAIDNARLFEQVRQGRTRLQKLSQQLLDVQERERRRIALELHDRIGQTLTAIKINLQSAQQELDPERQVQSFDQMVGTVERALQQVRNLSLDLRPSMLDDFGLVAALRWYLDRQAQNAGFRVEFQAAELPERPDPRIETACFRVAQEAVTNIVRHASASSVRVELQQRDEVLYMTISDDGQGFDVQEAISRATRGESIGLLGMQERVQLLGGKLELFSTTGQGSIVRTHFPVTPTQPLERRLQGRPPG